ncbi:MAG: hypothetical protein RXN89_03900 [Vulcanisaeta sp.]|jgi:hypothetical protein
MSCSVYLDRRVFAVSEPIYITLVNLGSSPLYVGSWGIVDEFGKTIYLIEPPQIMINPSSSFVVVWFQFDNDGRQVGRGRFRVVWRPLIGGNVLECFSDFFEIL